MAKKPHQVLVIFQKSRFKFNSVLNIVNLKKSTSYHKAQAELNKLKATMAYPNSNAVSPLIILVKIF